jgi:hypothetical protein
MMSILRLQLVIVSSNTLGVIELLTKVMDKEIWAILLGFMSEINFVGSLTSIKEKSAIME